MSDENPNETAFGLKVSKKSLPWIGAMIVGLGGGTGAATLNPLQMMGFTEAPASCPVLEERLKHTTEKLTDAERREKALIDLWHRQASGIVP